MLKRLLVLLSPWVIFSLGVLCNILVITANGGMMPVVNVPVGWTDGKILAPGLILDNVHIVWGSWMHLKFLADWIQIPRESVASPGDMLLFLGDWLTPYAIGAWFALEVRAIHDGHYKRSNRIPGVGRQV